MNTFSTFQLPQQIIYGHHALTQLGLQTTRLGRTALLISDRIMEKIGTVQQCQQHLEEVGIVPVCYLDVNSEPTDFHVTEALAVCLEHQCDVIIAVGGGSCIDAAKAVSVLATNGGQLGDYVGGKAVLSAPPIPLIAIPTTAGTGSEMTNVTVIINTLNDVKMMVKHAAFLPSVAIVDPMLTVSTPQSVTAATGIDALCHAIEAYISRKAQPMTDQFALSAIALISQNLRKAYTDGSDLEAREQMALASMQAGAAFSNASVTLVHGMSRPIGAIFHVPHGISNAMLLPAILEFSKDRAIERLAVVGRLFRPDLSQLSDQEMVDVAIQEVKGLCKDLQITNLESWGIDKLKFQEAVSKMAVDALASGSPGNNPRVPTVEEMIELYHTCYRYSFS
ncbi:iron-containing alcohol dehydrogenase [Paenibacillus sp. FSL H7-0331]|uniref:iron-containing alcohol dehydrogenase n=1 Tax=Paenibacillus sp. FSL H7-0331 TaxID=1920421 RepID=UPI00096D9A61|nr:iron-containing alcohol dehydrogenase [Paenibacillus sp. FSL H7-0331]OMF09010.1 alcohol dehydrogenase [Paenibacillus sp. FSL H7-0331]